MASLTFTAAAPARWRQLELGVILGCLLLAVLACLIICPIGLVVIQSFDVADPGQAHQWSLQGWQSALSEPLLRSSLLNTLSLTTIKQAVTLPLAIGAAWLLARSDLPGRHAWEFGFWVAFFLPPLTVTQSWLLLADPHYGLLNQFIGALSGARQGPFNIYSFWGLVWVDVITGALTVKVILLTPAFRYMNSTFEEASRIVGAGSWRTALRITVPIMLPVILVVLLLGTMASLQSFEVEQVLGTPFRFFVFSTMIYNLVQSSHPSYAPAAALAVMVLLAALPLIMLQLRITGGRRHYTTVTGQFKNQVMPLGPWRYPLLALFGLLMLMVLGVPVVLSTAGTFMTAYGFLNIAQPWTLNNWGTAFRDPQFVRSLANTLQLALGSAVAGLALYTLVAYVAVRSRFPYRRALDFVSWLPFTVPGLILSLAMLSLFLGVVLLRPLYGTTAILILTAVLTGMPLGVQIIKSSLLQLGPELEEASRIAGGSWLVTYRRIVLRLLGPALLTVGLIVFVGAARNVSYVALLSTTANQPLAMLQLNYLAQGKNEIASVIAFVVMLASVGGAFLARAAGFRGAAL
jgi:iron(III) transport system permease protein